ncbi:MAG: hypothetical protein LQ343_007591 [Gyalolechia ehrenbergii]|nr:MAG: hypothetical protein LQ343_007591 [Gyalolechia ehrenbergii]
MLFLPTFLLLALLPLILCTEDFYKLLGIDKSASERDIKKAYRTLSKKYHPDKNPGDETAKQKFVSIADAYDALSDPASRRIYDQYGHEGLAQHRQQGGAGGQHHDPFDLFSRFFGGSGHFGHSSNQRRGHDMEVHVSVPLRDFYTGHTHDFAVEKQQICEECEGSGSADGKVETCSVCDGAGRVVQKHMLAPGIFQQLQMQCEKCGGKGKQIVKACAVCGGKRVVRRKSSYVLDVEKGMPKGARVVYENEGDESPDWVAGDLVVVVGEKEAELGSEEEERVDGAFMRRKGRELFWKEVLSLREAWMGGWTRNLTHLDGHVVQLGRERGAVVQPGMVDVLKDEGMPTWMNEREEHEEDFGRLNVEYAVVLPDQMEKPMEKEFWALWEKWRRKNGVDLGKDSGRPEGKVRDEL